MNGEKTERQTQEEKSGVKWSGILLGSWERAVHMITFKWAEKVV